MGMTAKEDDEFTTFLRGKALEAKQAIKYSASHFLSMLGSIGGYQTVVTLLSQPNISDGFVKLYENQRLDLSVEALVIQSKWIKHFDERLVRAAKNRLIKAKFNFVIQDKEHAAPTSSSVEPTHTAEIASRGALSTSSQEQQLIKNKKKLPFLIGKTYARTDVFRALDLNPAPSGGAWFTGHTEHEGNHFIFCNIGASGRTGHEYNNHFVEDHLVWFSRRSARLENPSIQQLILAKNRVYVFYRFAERDPFVFAGCASPAETYDEQPVKIVWAFDAEHESANQNYPPGSPHSKIEEGALKTVTMQVYERDRGARLKCVSHWGWQCVICGFDFLETYGEIGKNFIHVHHLKPLSEIREAYFLDPIADLRPVCPNCHSMLHRTAPALSIETLRKKLCAQKTDL